MNIGDLSLYLNYIDTFRRNKAIPSRRNLAIARVAVTLGTGIEATVWAEDWIAVSGRKTYPGTVPLLHAPQFETFDVPPGHDRRFDTEVKLLEAIASRCAPESTGLVDLVTERSPCPSCASVIQQFRERFPGIQLVVADSQGRTF